MKKNKWISMAFVVCAVAGSLVLSNASETVDVESAMAGVAVDLNNYFASSLHPEEELRDFLNSAPFVSSTALLKAEETSGEGESTEEENAQEETTQEESSESEKITDSEETTEASESEQEEETDEESSEAAAEPESEKESETVKETEPVKTSPYANVAVSRVHSGSYVNVRSEANTSSEVLGKLYNDCAATIIRTVAGEDGDWYEIRSGSVQGYIKAEYFITGDAAEKRAIEIGKMIGCITGNGVRLRSKPDLESSILTLLYSGEKYAVTSVEDHFVKLMVDDDLEGYVYDELIDVSVKFDTAISIAEEKAKLEEEARKKAEAEEAARKLAEAKKKKEEEEKRKEQESAAAAENQNGGEAPAETTAPPAQVNTPTVTSASRDALVSYAKQWVGVTPYKYGGTSLSNGADCSGFVQACYADALGVSIPRDSRSMASKCAEISEGDLQPGDLVFYNKGGSINHVALYIGGGQVVHASNASVGTIISNMKYREPCKYGRFID